MKIINYVCTLRSTLRPWMEPLKFVNVCLGQSVAKDHLMFGTTLWLIVVFRGQLEHGPAVSMSVSLIK